MPISKKKDGWYWGSKGPFDSRDKAEEVAQAAHASGYEKFIDFMKEGDGGGGIGGFTSADVSTVTYGSTDNPKKKLKKDMDDIVFTSTEDAEETFDSRKQKIKDQTGLERVESFLQEFSPIKSLDKAYGEPYTNIKSNRKKGVMTTGMGTSGTNMSTTPDHSHATTQKLDKSFVLELVEFALKKNHNAPSHYGDYSLNPHQRLQPADVLQSEGSQKRPHMPSTETSVPHAGIENPTVHNMGRPGSDGGNEIAGRNMGPMNDGDEKVGAQQVPKKRKGYIKSGATLEMPAQSGNNFQAMEKADTVGGGHPHSLTVHQPRQGGTVTEDLPQYIEAKGEKPMNQDIQQNEFEEKTKEKRRRDKQDAESIVDPIATAGSLGGSMEKGFNLQNNDALERGGDLDKDKPLPNDILLDEKEVNKYMKKTSDESISKWLKKFLVNGLS